ncbi:F0F1 ATP synthase subunit A [bacterium SCSIO 12741]|nr:F0F1 ATP synthase subunit A [bacterium SCSIO 12741]
MHRKSIYFSLSLALLVFVGFSGFSNSQEAPADTLNPDQIVKEIESAVQEKVEALEEEAFNPNEMIMHHVLDAHEWHLWGHTSLPLPIILWDEGLHMFSSAKFHHGEDVVESNGKYYFVYHEKIYRTDASGQLNMDDHGHPTNVKPLDLSITKNVFSMLISALVLMLLFMSMARSYKKNPGAPKGLAAWLEPLVLFVRDEIAKPYIGEAKHRKFIGFLLTVFFFIWVNNLMGLIPFFPGGANLTGNISVTVVLGLFSFIIINVSGNKHYWGHLFDPMGSSMPLVAKIPLYIILVPIEVAGIFIKVAALMIRLFANITAGHIIVLSLIAIIFVKNSIGWAGLSVPMTLFISTLELLVAALQAYIFTMLTALFIGQATQDHH